MLKTSEHAFESVIEAALLAQGYHKRSSQDYDPELCLVPQDVFDFIQASQPSMWARFLKIHGGDAVEAKAQFLKKLAKDLEKRGTLALLRERPGFRIDGCKFKLIYFQPVSGLNPESQKQYLANRFAALRQLYYKPHSPDRPYSGPSLDLVLFVNGLPLFSVELKNQVTGQSVEEARRQYRQSRDPAEPLFAFGRCLAHFAVDNNQVYVTGHLQGSQTAFLPFNQGYAGGAGNPPSAAGFATAYLWQQTWARDSVLNLLQHFIHEIEVEDDKGHKTGEKRLIFPRYHQIEAVRRLVQDAYEQGAGRRYLIQHSAGSGKSYSIGWLAHQLSVLHDRDDNPVFNSIIVITDRRVLDRQLQRTMRQFQQVAGVVENIDKTSRQLKEALESGKKIIVTTLQKFPVIVNSIGELPGQRFGVIIDEAHSSQSGESRKSVHEVLTVKSLDDEAEADEEEAPGQDMEDVLIEEAGKRKLPPNVSFFAFTATPKPKTIELFGAPQSDGRYAPFSLYSMRQAIEEGFILDVLENYTTYRTYWNLLKTIEEDPHYDRHKAAPLLKAFVEEHQLVLDKKVEIIVEHLAAQVIPQIKGQARAMLVTRSRKQAVRYKLAIDHYIKEKGYSFKTLVAFSGALQVSAGGQTYTEANMNGFSEKQTAELFKRNEYRLLIVANKFQTGFDQPLLHTMYIDRKLNGVHAVQTLSRANRTHPDKDGTAILDFVNESDVIQKAFQPYYDRTILSEKTDPNLLYDLEARLDYHFIYTGDELDRFARLYLTAPDQNAALPQLHAIVDPAVERFNQAPAEAQANFRKALTDYVRLYAFLAQTARFEDADLEKLYLFGRFLARKLPRAQPVLPLQVQQQIELESLRVARTGGGKIELERGEGRLQPLKVQEGAATYQAEEQESLSAIIKELNTQYGFQASDEEIVTVQRIEARLDRSEALKASAEVNTRENFKLSFENIAKEKFQELIEDNFRLYKKIMDDPDFAQKLLDILLERYLKRLGRLPGNEFSGLSNSAG
jgi:type I restriction enzyme R subunit